MDHFKIGAMLDWQYDKYEGESDFIKHLEYFVYENIRERNIRNKEIILEKIISWLQTKKLNSKKIIEESDIDNISFKVEEKLNEKFEEKIEKVFSDSQFSFTEKQAENNSKNNSSNENEPEVIFKNGESICDNLLDPNLRFFPDKNQHQILVDLIVDGKQATGICFKGQKNQLPEFFQRLLNREELEVDDKKVLANWIVKSFVVKLKNEKIEEFRFDTVWKILKTKKKNPVTKKKRILTDKYPVIQNIPYKSE
jgi:hypothetical protein